jgi:hypothetical protein
MYWLHGMSKKNELYMGTHSLRYIYLSMLDYYDTISLIGGSLVNQAHHQMNADR